MGSNIKTSIFDERASKALKKWHDEAKKHNKNEKLNSGSVSVSPSAAQSPMTSPRSRHVYQNRSMGYAGDGFRKSHPDNEFSDIKIEIPVARSELSQQNVVQGLQLSIEKGRDKRDEGDFSFAKLDTRN
jgi:Mlo family